MFLHWKLIWFAEGKHGKFESEHKSLRDCWEKLDQIEDLDYHKIVRVKETSEGSYEYGMTTSTEHEVFEEVVHN